MSWTVAPEVMLAAVVAVFFLCVTGTWSRGRPPPLASVTPASDAA
jgi:hypothetical protein